MKALRPVGFLLMTIGTVGAAIGAAWVPKRSLSYYGGSIRWQGHQARVKSALSAQQTEGAYRRCLERSRARNLEAVRLLRAADPKGQPGNPTSRLSSGGAGGGDARQQALAASLAREACKAQAARMRSAVKRVAGALASVQALSRLEPARWSALAAKAGIAKLAKTPAALGLGKVSLALARRGDVPRELAGAVWLSAIREARKYGSLAAWKKANPKPKRPKLTAEDRFANWPTVAGFVLLLILGVAMVRISAARAASQAAAAEGGVPEAREQMAAAMEMTKTLAREMGELPIEDLHTRLDAITSGPLFQFPELRQSISDSFGLKAYADVMGPFAQAERFLFRAWSAATDGYKEEAEENIRLAEPILTELDARLTDLAGRDR